LRARNSNFLKVLLLDNVLKIMDKVRVILMEGRGKGMVDERGGEGLREII